MKVFQKEGKSLKIHFFKTAQLTQDGGSREVDFFLFEKIFSKGFCFERLFRFFVIQKTFSKGFCFERLLQKSQDYYVLKNLG